MRKLLLVPILLAFGACARHNAKTGSASTTLVAYYAAVQSMDTSATYALCSSARLALIKSNAENYFANCYRLRDTIRVLREIPTADTEAEVLFTDVMFDRATGIQVDSAVVECTMVKEAGEWRVQQCHKPWPADTLHAAL